MTSRFAGGRRQRLQQDGDTDVPALPPDVISWSMTNLDLAATHDVALEVIRRVVKLVSPDDLKGVTPDAKAKDHFVIVDCVGVCERDLTDSRPLEKKRTVTFDKLLDAIGDLYLLGRPLLGAFYGYKSGHALNNRLLRALLADETAWEVGLACGGKVEVWVERLEA